MCFTGPPLARVSCREPQSRRGRAGTLPQCLIVFVDGVRKLVAAEIKGGQSFVGALIARVFAYRLLETVHCQRVPMLFPVMLAFRDKPGDPLRGAILAGRGEHGETQDGNWNYHGLPGNCGERPPVRPPSEWRRNEQSQQYAARQAARVAPVVDYIGHAQADAIVQSDQQHHAPTKSSFPPPGNDLWIQYSDHQHGPGYAEYGPGSSRRDVVGPRHREPGA